MAPKGKRRAREERLQYRPGEEGCSGPRAHNECGGDDAEVMPVPAAKRTCTLTPDASAQMQYASRMAEAAASLPADVHLIASDGSRHPAHRLVLSARSPFFLKMLSTRMLEQRTGEVSLPDVDPERLSAMLAWMYGREAVVGVDGAAEALSLLELVDTESYSAA